LRLTPQRQQVYDVLIQKRDHPTAEEVFIRAKQAMPDISMATVYKLSRRAGAMRTRAPGQLERGATRFCPNMESTVITTATSAARCSTWR